MNRERYDSITGLRGFIAILTVMGYHYFILLGNPFEGGAVAAFFKNVVIIIGMTGPNAFFLMSGFLMHGRTEKRILTGELKFGDYLYGKIRKLYPMMLAGTLIVFAAERIGYEILGFFPVHASGGEMRYSVLALILSVFGVQSGWISDGDTLAVNGPSWFISCLMICYILYYIVVRSIGKWGKKTRCEGIKLLIFSLLMLTGMIFMVHPVSFPLLYASSARGMWGFFAGVLLAAGSERLSSEAREKVCLPVVGLMVVVGVISAVTADTMNIPIWLTYIQWAGILYLCLYGNVLKRIFSWKPLVYAGERSLAFFLGNLPVLSVITCMDSFFGWGLDYSTPAVWGMIFVVSAAAAEIMHRVLE